MCLNDFLSHLIVLLRFSRFDVNPFTTEDEYTRHEGHFALISGCLRRQIVIYKCCTFSDMSWLPSGCHPQLLETPGSSHIYHFQISLVFQRILIGQKLKINIWVLLSWLPNMGIFMDVILSCWRLLDHPIYTTSWTRWILKGFWSDKN